MIARRKTKIVKVADVPLGSGAPVVIQSMTKVPTIDVAACVRQINRLTGAGCGLVRVSVPRRADTRAFADIVAKVRIPLIADVHFSAARAIEAIEAGAAKIRLNPGNVKKTADIERIIDSAKSYNIAIRIGVNEASIRDLKGRDVPAPERTALMLREMQEYVRLFEKRGFDRLVLSAKSSDTVRTIEINRAISGEFDYPVHLGLTHAGLACDAIVPSAVALGTLLAEGIGDTVRVSVAGDPVREVEIAEKILVSLGLLARREPELIVCPTCARVGVDLVPLAKTIKKALQRVKKPLRVAVMGCIVNGPGEAADADLALCAAEGRAFLYRHGRKIASVPQDQIVARMLEELERL